MDGELTANLIITVIVGVIWLIVAIQYKMRLQKLDAHLADKHPAIFEQIASPCQNSNDFKNKFIVQRYIFLYDEQKHKKLNDNELNKLIKLCLISYHAFFFFPLLPLLLIAEYFGIINL